MGVSKMKIYLLWVVLAFGSVAIAGEVNDQGLVFRQSNSVGFSNRIFSKAPDRVGSNLIYPPSSGSFDRWTYFLARSTDKTFSVPVWDFDSNHELKLFGYGAAPVSVGAGIGKERCPEKPQQFSSYRWVKVWLFRAGLPPSVGNPDQYDFLHVVSPVGINLVDMQDNSSSSSALPYMPYRFYKDLDCQSIDPANAASGDCLASNAISNYGLKLHGIADNGDPAASDPNHPGMYPFCALQSDK